MVQILNNIMTKTGTHIIESQNTDSNITKLAAQKHIYSVAKKLFLAQIIIVTVIPVVLSLLQIILKRIEIINYIFAGYVALSLIAEVVLDIIINKKKELAAAIQESFDCSVLDIIWNYVLIEEKPTPEICLDYYSKYTKYGNISRLHDWYSIEIESVDTNIATVICQRTNCVYDFTMRNKFNLGLGLVAGSTFILLLGISLFANSSLSNFLLAVLFPSLPIFLLAIKQFIANNKSIKNLQALKSLIESTLSSVTIDSTINSERIRQIQDKIYTNRSSTPMLPDWVFEKFRSNLETQMHHGVASIIQDIKSNQS